MIVYRLSKAKYHLDLSRKGAELSGGRWNSKGIALLYTSQSRALAFAEVAIHIPVGIMPKDYVLISISVPDTAGILKLANTDLPQDWRSNPPSDITQKIGDRFVVEAKYPILQVPSAVVPGDFNFLVNPGHPQVKGVTIVHVEPFEFDSRFVARGK
jgi:RES domain-containing protein